jgi:IclR family acetate operon transcriptional repressor
MRRSALKGMMERRMAQADAHPLATGDRLRSVSRALAVLDTLAERPSGQTAKEVAAATALTLPTVYHLLNTLSAAGYAARDPDSKLFTLGPRIPQLHQAFLARARPLPSTLPFLRALHQTTGENVYLIRLFGDDAVVIDLAVGPEPRKLGAGYVGYSLPAHLTAAGRVLLASAGPGRSQTYLAGRYGHSAGPFPSADAGRLEADLARIRTAGFAVDRGDSNPDIWCLAAPIVMEAGKALEALTIVTDRATFLCNQAALQAALIAVANAAAAVSAANPDGEPIPERTVGQHLFVAAARALDLPA